MMTLHGRRHSGDLYLNYIPPLPPPLLPLFPPYGVNTKLGGVYGAYHQEVLQGQWHQDPVVILVVVK